MPLQLKTHALGRKDSPLEFAVEMGLWGCAGVFVNAFARGIQQKPILGKSYLGLVWGLGFVGIGYGVYVFENNMMSQLEKERDLLVLRRMKRLGIE
ncbi:hypothetical protein BC833DRAFT_592687 [Globomyces pollinis-pini]|nr:hypothetical protein BC833DRAFT_592687 [Globomyces pollinis-pini]